MTKKILYLILIVFVLFLVFLFYNNRNDIANDTFTVRRGNVAEEVFETGSVKKGDSATLSFKEGGRVESVFVSENDFVERGDIIAVLESGTLGMQLAEAKEAERSAKTALEKLLRGASEEDLNVARSAVSSAERAL